MTAARCETLVEVLGLKVALAASAAAALQGGAVAASPPVRERPAANGGGRAVRGVVRAGGGLLTGVLPKWGGVVALAAGLRFAWARFELGASYAPPRAASYASPASVGADFQLFSGQLRGCATIGLGAAELPICAGVELGAIVGTGFGAQQRFSRADAYGAVLLGPALRVPLSQALSLWIELDGSLAFVRPPFGTRGLPQLYRPPALGSRGVIGFEVPF